MPAECFVNRRAGARLLDYWREPRGRIDQVPASTATAAPPGNIASHGLTNAAAPAPDQVIDEKASAKVAIREETWRRRNRLRLTWARNQNWIMLADNVA